MAVLQTCGCVVRDPGPRRTTEDDGRTDERRTNDGRNDRRRTDKRQTQTDADRHKRTKRNGRVQAGEGHSPHTHSAPLMPAVAGLEPTLEIVREHPNHPRIRVAAAKRPLPRRPPMRLGRVSSLHPQVSLRRNDAEGHVARRPMLRGNKPGQPSATCIKRTRPQVRLERWECSRRNTVARGDVQAPRGSSSASDEQ